MRARSRRVSAGHAPLERRSSTTTRTGKSSTTASQSCTASAWIKGPRGLDVRIRLREYHEGDRVGYNSGGLVLPDSNWHQITIVLPVTRADDSMDLNVYGKNLAPGLDLLIDDVSETCR